MDLVVDMVSRLIKVMLGFFDSLQQGFVFSRSVRKSFLKTLQCHGGNTQRT